MKNLFLLVFITLLGGISAYAQHVPQGMRYQAIARDMDGHLLNEQPITIQIHLRSGERGEVLYTEQHRVTTNSLGLFAVTVGSGKTIFGEFASIPWSLADIWLDIDMDETGGKKFNNINSSQLLTVPYAFHAGTAGSYLGEGTEEQKNGLQFYWSINGNVGTFPSNHFVGTRDYKDFIMRTNNLTRLTITKDGVIDIEGSLNVGDNLTVGNNALIGNDLRVDRDVSIGRNLLVEQNTQMDGMLQVDGTLGIDGIATFNNTTQSTSKDNGAVVIEGGVGIEKNINIGGNSVVTGNSTVNGTTGLNGQVTISASVVGGDASYGAYPLRVEGSAQGIAVKVNAGTPNGNNNFITFFDNGNTARGRIEGQTAGEVASEPQYIFETSILTAEIVAAGVNIGLSALPNACVGAGAVACPPEPSVVAIAIAEEILAIANLAAYQIFAFANLGVTYQSGGADYAEFLERINVAETMTPGDIVGVTGGKISKQTGNSSQYLVVSTNPAILGNMQSPMDEVRFEKVAFMGQVPVKVRGQVNIGDYILVSGMNDGTGIGISPDQITTKQYREIVGVAWSSAPAGSKISLINMAIGLNTNDIAKVVEQQQSQITKLEQEFASLEKRLVALESGKPIITIQETEVPSSASEEVVYDQMLDMLNAEQIEEAILLLKDSYSARGIDINSHLGLNKLFNDSTFRMEIIQKVQENYQITRSNLMEMESRKY